MLIPLDVKISDAILLRVFKLHLKSLSYADLWWRALPAAQKDTWEHLCDAFEKEWLRNGITPRPTPSPPQDTLKPSPSVSPTGTPPPIPSSQPTSHASMTMSQPSTTTLMMTTAMGTAGTVPSALRVKEDASTNPQAGPLTLGSPSMALTATTTSQA